MTHDTADTPGGLLVQRAAALVPLLRRYAPEGERARRVPRDVLDALSEAGVFKMMAPRRFGGFEADFQTQCDVLAHIARGCPSTSWIATIYSAMGWLAAAFPDEAQEELLGDGDPRISGVFSPTGTAVATDGGLVVNGRWGYNTGGFGSRWTVLNAMSDGGAGVPTCVVVRSDELRSLDDWNASGMAATGSSTVIADNIFVPAHRALPLPAMLEGRYPQRANGSNPYFNYPLAPVLTVNAAGMPIGTARGALELFQERLPGRQITYTDYTNQAAAPVTHLQLGEAALTIDSADAHTRRACAILDEPRDQPFTTLERVRARAHVAYATGLARKAVDILFFASGASAIQSNVPIQRFQRDIQALANHAIMHAETGVELYGRVLCGLPPNSILI